MEILNVAGGAIASREDAREEVDSGSDAVRLSPRTPGTSSSMMHFRTQLERMDGTRVPVIHRTIEPGITTI
jgi:hypothetical protein